MIPTGGNKPKNTQARFIAAARAADMAYEAWDKHQGKAAERKALMKEWEAAIEAEAEARAAWVKEGMP